MKEVFDRLFIGSGIDCFSKKDGWVTIHACKHPCHQRAVGYKGNLSSKHPNYLVLEKGNNLYLNIIDPPGPLFMMPLFTEFLKFVRKHWEEDKNVLIHCNEGNSRAPSLALLFLAKEVGTVNNESYKNAKQDFKKLYQPYSPGLGIQIYLSKHWNEIE